MDSQFLQHEPCPECGSKDNLARYDDGHAHCFGCGYYEHANGEPVVGKATINKQAVFKGTHKAIPDRKIKEQTVKKYGVGITDSGEHFYPYYDDAGQLMATKIRAENKQFKVSGTMAECGLFGSHLFKPEGRYVTVVEGELDALAAYEMLGSKWPVVSVPNGASAAKKAFQANLEWLEGFENVVIVFDNDEAGAKAAREAASVLSPNKAKIVTLDLFNDPCEYLKGNAVKSFTEEWWNAKPYVVTGVITLKEAWKDFISRGQEEIIPFPDCFGTLNSMLNGGIAAGEVTILGALTSVGKTTFVNEILYHLWRNTSKKVGCAFLEASNGEVIENLLTIHTSHNLRLEERDNLDYDALYCDMIEDGRIALIDHQGAIGTDELFLKLRSMVKGQGCQVLLIDPLQVAVPGNSMEAIDEFMDRLLKLAKETNVSIVVVSHMRKPDNNRPHNVNEYDLKGSGSINQIAFNTILLSRDKLAEDEYERNSTMVQVVKCRRTGLTGLASWVYYDSLSGRLERGQPPEVYQANQEDEF